MSALSALLCSRKIRNTTRCCYISPPLGGGGGDKGEGNEGNTHRGMNATLLSFPEFISRCEFVNKSTARTTVSSLDEIDFSRAVATPSDLYGAYLGLMRSGLWLECTPRCEMFTVGEQEEEEEGGKGKRRREEQQQPPLLCLMCEPNPKPEETKKTNTKKNTTTRNKRDGNVGNGAKRRARARTKAYAFALNRGVVDETFLETVANGDGLERLADPSLKEQPEAKKVADLAALAMEEEKGTAAKLPLKEDEKENERNHRPGREEENVKEEGKEEEQTAPYESIIVVTIDSDGTTTAMRVSRGFVEPEELRRKEENDDEEENDLDASGDDDDDEEENGFLGGGGGEAKNPPKGKKKKNKTKKSIPVGALAFSSSDDDDDLDDEYSE